jgi:hypothetical protein
MIFQRCAACGTCEARGGYCTYCRSATYVLIEHRHFAPAEARGSACPLGPTFNRGPAKQRGPEAIQRAAQVNDEWQLNPVPKGAEKYVVRELVHVGIERKAHARRTQPAGSKGNAS